MEIEMDGDPSIVAIVESPTETERKKHPGGRPKGQPNRATVTMRYLLEQIVAGQMVNVDQALRDILNGRPADIDAKTGVVVMKGVAPNPMGFTTALTNIMDFSLPRLTRVEVKDDRSPPDDITISATASPEEAQQAYLKLVQS
jgi:hypothetical protein